MHDLGLEAAILWWVVGHTSPRQAVWQRHMAEAMNLFGHDMRSSLERRLIIDGALKLEQPFQARHSASLEDTFGLEESWLNHSTWRHLCCHKQSASHKTLRILVLERPIRLAFKIAATPLQLGRCLYLDSTEHAAGPTLACHHFQRIQLGSRALLLEMCVSVQLIRR